MEKIGKWQPWNKSTKRARWMISIISESLCIKDQDVEDALEQPSNTKLLEDFINIDGPQVIFIYYQVQDQPDDPQGNQNADPTLFVTNGEQDKLKDKGIFFARAPDTKQIRIDDANDTSVWFGEITPNCIHQLSLMIKEVYQPLLRSLNDGDWEQCEKESVADFMALTNKCAEEFKEAINSMESESDKYTLNQEYVQKLQANELLQYYQGEFSSWLNKIQKKLNGENEENQPQMHQMGDKKDQGPKAELEYWRQRMQSITSMSENLKNKDFVQMKNALSRARQPHNQQRTDDNINKLLIDYGRLDVQLTDKLNEAKDNVKYLTTLEKFIEPLYSGTPQQIIDSLPALMNAIKMIHTIARFYNTADKMTGLFIKITNQMIENCKQRIATNENGKPLDIWSREPTQLIEILGSCLKLNQEYKDCYKATKNKVAEMPKGKAFDFSETQIFGKFDLFCRRLSKLIEVFTMIQQFKSLAKQNLEGMETLNQQFKEIIDEFKKKKHDLLDYQTTKFDRDYVQLGVKISQLDTKLQEFIDSNFNKFKNIEYSLKLLHKFENTLKRDSLKHNLTNKYNSILQNYATELENISKKFTDEKQSPPMVRNMPPEAGRIIWARHLFQKITGPIHMFRENVINQSKIRNYYGTYNILGKQLTIYEMWYYQNWCSEIEKSKAALQATLLVRHEENKQLYVNFDIEILQLIREAKCMDRQTIEIPESARIILLQEEKFKMYYNELQYVIKEYERIISKIKPITKTLLGPHIEDLELKLRPGMVTLTWTSMNIDSYLQQVHQGLNKMEQLIISVNDIIENRIENNLKEVSKVVLVSLPEVSKPLSLEEFVDIQESYIKNKTGYLASKNIEVERAVDDLLQTILLYQLDPHVDPVLPEEAKKIKRYYFWYFYQALLNSTQSSLNQMKHRVCGKRDISGGADTNLQPLNPFFEVFIDLQKEEIILSPTLEHIQKAINKAATAVLRCSKDLYNWEQQDKNSETKGSFYEMIAQDKEIVKVILLLTGSIQGTKNKVNDFLMKFDEYKWLYKDSIPTKLKAFEKENPTLQEYEEILKHFSQIEKEIDNMDQQHLIGAMQLKTENLLNALKSSAKEWKNQYAQHLHKTAKEKLDSLSETTKQFEIKLRKEVKDIDSLGNVMETLEHIRKRQAEIDILYKPVQEMYSILDQYLIGGINDKDEMDNRSMMQRQWDSLIEIAKVKAKELQKKQSTHLAKLKDSVKDFKKKVVDFRKDYEINGPMVPGIRPKEANERLRRFEDEYQMNEKLYKINKQGEDLFGLVNQSYPELEKTDAELRNLKKLYQLYNEVNEFINQGAEKSWAEIQTQDIVDMLETIMKYSDQCLRLPKDLKEWEAYKDLRDKIDNLKQVLPIIQELKKPSIKSRHWERIKELTGSTKLNYQQEDQFYLENLLEANLLDQQDDIIDVTDSADKQLKIESALSQIKDDWEKQDFEFSKWGNKDFNCILNGMAVQTIQEKLEEDQMTLASLNAQRHVTPFKAEVEYQIRIFSDVAETLDTWVKVQILWTSLEAVFTGGDIARQMPLEAKKFQGIDKNWLRIMEKASETKRVVTCCQNDMLKEWLPVLSRDLESCQQSLHQYLEDKRKKFPRFYFVADKDLLSILSQGSNPTMITDQFQKLFDAITTVAFKPNPDKKGVTEQMIVSISQVQGRDSETINLYNPVKCEGNIESWLGVLEISMQDTMKDIIRAAAAQAFSLSDSELENYVNSQKSQVALIGIQMIWTQKMTEALTRGATKNEKQLIDQKKKEITSMMNKLTNMCLLEYKDSLIRQKVETLVTIMVHQKEITDKNTSRDVNDFEWQKQTRFYWKDEIDNAVISITDWDCNYSYEFLGSKERLCITPLTDRCYISLAQALSMYYGGAPAGPAGTGKTETVKDMGRTLGIYVIVTNCSDQHRYKDMAKIFKGLCQSGLWGCFDEFNRIELEVLSVVAMQIESITSARKQHMEKFMFPEETDFIKLNPNVGYFITMNPGYAGRQELPENLKVLFRGVTMMVPDREIIIKVKLASVGYLTIEILSKKFNILYKLCEEQLSKQRHYDFGLRNILSVLRTAGNTKRCEPTAEEEMLLMRSLRDMNYSKLVYDDIQLFNSLLLDIFPRQTSVPKKRYFEVEEALKRKFNENKALISQESFILKIIQVHETQLVRHGFMLVGPTGSGKSTILDILTNTLGEVNGVPYKQFKLNPKAITVNQMYGVKSDISDDWTPGIFSTLWSKHNGRNVKYNAWLTFDGPVDTIWIESLNTVLDDNKLLTLANGERIAMTDNCKVVCEVENLNNASPATVSRCGQIYVSSIDLGVNPVMKGWIEKRKSENRQDEAEKLNTIISKYMINQNLIDQVEKEFRNQVFQTPPIVKVVNFLAILNGCLEPLRESKSLSSEAEYEKLVIFSIVWSLGGVFEPQERAKFHEFLQNKGCPLPQRSKENETIFDYFCKIQDDKVLWKVCQPEEWKPPEKAVQFSQLLLPTVDSYRAEILLNLTLKYKATLLVGTSGTAKTSSILMYSQKFSKDTMMFNRMNFSSATTPQMFQENIEVACESKYGKDFGPPGGKQMTVFIDDMSMPQINKWGDQETLEIVRQLIEAGGFYMLEKSMRGTFKNIKNLSYIGAMNHPGGGRNDIPNRAKRQFFVFNMILPLSVEAIFGPLIKLTFRHKSYTPEFQKVIDQLPNATVKLWNKVKNTLLPTPAKFHYIFNMRELSRVFKGILQIRRDVIQTASSVGNLKPEIFVVGLWRHECERVFADKLVNQKDKDNVVSYIQEISLEVFSQLESELLEKLPKEKPFLFCDFLRPDQKNEEGLVEVEGERIYEAISNMEDLKQRCYDLLTDYNEKTPKKMNLVLFDDAIKHLLRISRALKMSRSSALLVGVGGSGKQSLTKLAADIGKNVLKVITISKNFSEKDFKESLKGIFELASRFGKETTFILTDSEIKKEEFLEFINMTLSTGDIPGLLTRDEKESWKGDATTAYVKEFKIQGGYEPPESEILQYLVDRLRDKLHIVLCFSPVGVKFRERARKFPALFNECTIDWFLPWPEEALISVSQQFIGQFKELDTKAETKLEFYKHMGNIHIMVQNVCTLYFQKMRRAVYTTPKSYLSYISSFQSFYKIKYSELDYQEKRFKLGLSKIDEAAADIAKMEEELKKEDQKLKEASEKTAALMKKIEEESKKVNQKKEAVEKITQDCQKKKDEIQKAKEDAEKDLAQAMPALVRAQKAVDNLKAQDIVEMKQMRNPQEIMKYILDFVCVFFCAKLTPISIEERQFKKDFKAFFLKDSWDESGKPQLSNIDFMNNLKSFRKDEINEETIELLEPYLGQKNDWFNLERAKTVSSAAHGIMDWCFSIYDYHQKSKIVKPKQMYLIQQEGKLAVAEAELASNMEELRKVEAQQAALREQYNKQLGEKLELEEKANKTKKKINTARTLISSLSDEKERWGQGANKIGEDKRRLIGNCSISTAFISYCGPFNAEFRNLLINDYFFADMKRKGIPATPGLDLTSFLVDDATIGEWNLQGLPKDDLSIQNGIMVTNSTRWPLLIDPQKQGQNWIQNKWAAKIDPQWSITTLTHPKFKDKFLKLTLQNGNALIIENIENEVDPMLDPLLEKQFEKKGSTVLIRLGDEEFDYDKEFCMFMTCRLPNPEFSPELSAKTTIIDFTVTQKGLEQQLLGLVLSKEQKALEDSLTQLMTDVNQNTKNLQILDKNLLERLTSSDKNLLEDTDLMEMLNNTKTQSKEVKVKLADAELKTKEIQEKREQYRPIAIRGSALYFCMIEMQLVDWMYNSSLEQFLALFNYSIDNSEKAQLPSKRVDIIIKYLTFHVYKYVNRGLFEKDKTTFVLMVCFKILQTAGKISANDIGMFLKGGGALDLKSEKQNPFGFIKDAKVWLNILALSRHNFNTEPIPFYRDLPEVIGRNEAGWKAWIEKPDPENHMIPDIAERINSNEKEFVEMLRLTLIRCLREDRTLVAATQFIGNILGKDFIEPLSYPIDEIYQETVCYEPVIFLLSLGADPTSSIDELSKKKKKYPPDKVSMGEGQDRIARQCMNEGFINGTWIILQNCHLGLKFMNEIIDMLNPNAPIHQDFRLWITCEPHKQFPLGLLQKAIKVTNEPPKGLKAGLHKTFTTIINQDFLDKIDHLYWRQLIFTICYLHSIVQERRKFGPLGWCVPYEYNNSDLEASLFFVEKYLTNLMSVPTYQNAQTLPVKCEIIQYMISDIQYGGRITDNIDRELFDAYAREYIKEGIFQSDHVFCEITIEGTREKLQYKIPSNPMGEIQKYRDYIDKSVPQIDSPNIFGLHQNADLTFRTKESLEMIETIMETRPKDSSGGGGKSREEVVQDKAKELLQKIPPDYVIPDVREQINKLGGPKLFPASEKGMAIPLNIFLFQEISRMQFVISQVKKGLKDTIDAIDGLIIMTPDILDIINCVADAKVPPQWIYDPTGAEFAWLYPNLGGWISQLIERSNQLTVWLKNGRPYTYQLGYFFNPQGFLTAMKQEVSRGKKYKPNEKEAWPLDDVDYSTTVKDAAYDPSRDTQQEGVFIQGLWLEGGRWNRSYLDDPIGKEQIFPLPTLYVTAVLKKKQEGGSNSYNCPVYKYPKRTDKYIIFRVKLNSESQSSSQSSKWQLRGVALLCQKD